MTRPGAQTPAIEEVARIAERLAVLMSAGVSPVSAWDYLVPPGVGTASGRARRWPRRGSAGTEPGTRNVLLAAAHAAHAGERVADAIAAEAASLPAQLGDAWRALAATWDVATQVGAPLSGCLRDQAAAFRDLGHLHRDLAVALTGPRATARLVLVLPAVALLFGTVLGFDTLHTLFLTGPGLGCLGAGSLLMLAAAGWNRRLVAAARAQEAAPGIELDLTAIGMAGGGALDRARDTARGSAERFGLRPAGAARTEVDGVIDRVLDLSARAGVPAGELLRSEADQARRDARSAGRQRAETLAVALMLPLGVCVLPAFMLVGGGPASAQRALLHPHLLLALVHSLGSRRRAKAVPRQAGPARATTRTASPTSVVAAKGDPPCATPLSPHPPATALPATARVRPAPPGQTPRPVNESRLRPETR